MQRNSPLDPPASFPFRTKPDVASVAAELLWRVTHTTDPVAYLGAVLPVVSSTVGGDFASLAEAVEGRWSSIAQSGNRRALPATLLADSLDRESPAAADDWIVAPLGSGNAPAQAVVVHLAPDSNPTKAMAVLTELVPVLREGLAAVGDRHQDRRRARRLETILEITNQWNRTREVEPLLVKMAEAATRLLGADRASIFVWDRRNHELVGRPALGVRGGELRIPDDRGVVGQVIKSGKPLRVDAATEPEKIDHRVDTQLGYQTRSLLCVPLRGRSGELFGAFELINKLSGSFTSEDETALGELAAHAAIALENAQDREELLSTTRQITQQAADQVRLIGSSPAIEALRSIIRRVADTELAVLILGENGTGKEVVAQSIHYLSRRRGKPFIAVNCAAIPDTLAESELFGHEKGAFTDARDSRLGKFELASGGTLFLDEIGDLSLSGQAKLLRVLEERILVRVGGSVSIQTDARLLAATNQDLAEMVRQKRFREDLYFRLNVVTLEIPPLRERPGDILPLAEHFLGDFCRKARRPLPSLSAPARKRLESHTWPGNVRELRNLMERIAYLSTEDHIEAEDLAFILSPRGRDEGSWLLDTSQTLADATVHFQSEYIKRAIQQSGGNMSQAAASLGLHRSNLYRKMRQLGMAVPD
ncbi:MAG: sigma-54-dependent Fis family transcriptional regulator [Pirellulales bacterium]|nr:sigma-54-dependent Fis family transcriptional regulator [Pirellulales bacterium]